MPFTFLQLVEKQSRLIKCNRNSVKRLVKHPFNEILKGLIKHTLFRQRRTLSEKQYTARQLFNYTVNRLIA